MDKLMLFSDGSVDTRTSVGYGAYLVMSEIGLSPDILKDNVKVKRFDDTSSTRLELQTLLWALGDIQTKGKRVIIYTDSQNIIGLESRRARYEKMSFNSKKKRPLRNGDLYKDFFALTDRQDLQFVKVAGHKPSKDKDYIEIIFGLVDRASRMALRKNDP